MPAHPNCGRCQRLAQYRRQNRKQYPDYFNAPVASFGPQHAALLVVGLAPGLHGANASGRPFTGDQSGVWFYRALYAYGFCNQPESLPGDGLELSNCIVTNAVKCLPPQNKPTGVEVNTCNRFLQEDIRQAAPEVIVALGKIAHDAVLKAFGFKLNAFPFGHAAEHELGEHQLLIDSYHCSRYNQQTGRLTEEMFSQIFQRAREIVHLKHEESSLNVR